MGVVKIMGGGVRGGGPEKHSFMGVVKIMGGGGG